MSTDLAESRDTVPVTPAGRWLGYLSDEMRNCQRDADVLRDARDLLDRAHNDTGDAGHTNDIDSLCTATNLVSLALFRMRALDRARELCHLESGYLLGLRGSAEWPRIVLYALQPRINLLRIEGYLGDVGTALAGLEPLDRLGDGRSTRFGGLDIDTDLIGRISGAGFDIRSFARNVRVAESCKILWRRGRFTELADLSERFVRHWPDLAAEGGVGHAEETPWLLGAETDRPTPTDRRLRRVRALHEASRLAYSDDPRASRRARSLLRRTTDSEGVFACAATPVRWDAHLADTLVRAGLVEPARTLLVGMPDRLRGISDPVLVRGIRERAAELGLPPVDDRAGPDVSATIMALAELVIERLSRG